MKPMRPTKHKNLMIISQKLSYDIFFPATKKKFNRNMHKVEKWFTTGLLISRQRKNLLAKNAFKNPSTENC